MLQYFVEQEKTRSRKNKAILETSNTASPEPIQTHLPLDEFLMEAHPPSVGGGNMLMLHTAEDTLTGVYPFSNTKKPTKA